MDKILADYEEAIIKIAKKVAGRNQDIVDDLAQIGRMVFIKLYPENKRWAFLSRAIKNEITRFKIEGVCIVTIPLTSLRRNNLSAVSVQLDLNLSTNDKNTADLDLIANLLHCIEADIDALSPMKKRSAKAYLRFLDGEDIVMSKCGKTIVEKLVQKYRSEANILLELGYD